MIVNVTKICWMMMKKKFVENRKKYYKMKKKRPILIISNYYLKKSNPLEKSFDGKHFEFNRLKLNVKMFLKISFESINLLQKANLNENLR